MQGIFASDASDVRGEEVDTVAVQVAASAVVVLGGAGVGVPGEDLGIAQGYAGVEGVGDGGVAQGVRADVPRDGGDLGDPYDHPVAVAALDRVLRVRAQDQPPFGALASAGLKNRSRGTVMGMVAGLLPLPTSRRTRCPRRVVA